MKKMKIVHVGNYKPESANGVHKTIVGLTKHLQELDVAVEIWHFTNKKKMIEYKVVNDISIFDLPTNKSRFQNFFRIPRETIQFITNQSREADILHLHSVFIPENLWCSKLNVPYILTPNGGYNPQVLNGRNRIIKKFWFQWFELFLLKNASAIHAVSPSEEKQLTRLVKNVPIFMLPNGIEDEKFSVTTFHERNEPKWLFLGRLAIEHKGLDLLMKGYALFNEKYKKQLTIPNLHLAGPDFRNGKNELIKLANSLNIENKVKFTGAIYNQDKWDVLFSSSLFIHTSRWEGLPFSILEALGIGLPVLITPETNISEYVKKYNAGWIVQGSPENIAEGFHKILKTSDVDLQLMSANAKNLAKREFSWKSIAIQMKKYYQSIIR